MQINSIVTINIHARGRSAADSTSCQSARMNGSFRLWLSAVICCWGILIGITGCGRSEPSAPSSDTNATMEGQSLGLSPEVLAQESQALSPSDSGPRLPVESQTLASGTVAAAPPTASVDAGDLSAALFGLPTQPEGDVSGAPGVDSSVSTAKQRLQLPADLSIPRLVDFLKSIDIEMQNVATGRSGTLDQADATAEMTRLATLKLQASTRLQEQSADDSPERILAIRGRLQALSHLAALGDLAAAEKLEELAWEQIDHKNASLSLDSQLVLVGLAMERLQNGASKDSGEILGLIERIANSPQTPDVSALMVMGQALTVLQRYGDEASADQVRTTIVQLFADHPNENVASMAMGMAGSPRFNSIEAWLRRFARGEASDAQQWRDLITELLDEKTDLTTVQYLAGAALQFESAGNDQLADATYQLIQDSANLAGRAADEIRIAIAAREARRSIIGQAVPLDSRTVDGTAISMSNYQGRVVVMPFWAIAIPESLTILQTLEQIRQQSDGRVEIVGMNLDSMDAPANEFLSQSPVEFSSFQSVTSDTGQNEMAKRFGVVSLPFVAIWDQSGKVVAINLSGRDLAAQIRKALGD